MSLALTIGVLTAGGVYLLLDRTFLRLVLGFVVLSHAVNLVLFAAGGADRRVEPLGSNLDPGAVSDALPQAFVLTAIVIAFSITVYMLVLAITGEESESEEETS
ncbi:Na(+)/H(+) antiporter subunit C [Aeromicrobium halocynthiae]|uniref:Na(+)/H(+) antiporter subunit C n=1 Tax=Aeromicrobium halocynthiae TaxID=560557 RepID=A0ABN2VZ39_9ACTN